MRIDHVAIAVKDLDDALAFYRDALGLEVTGRREVPAEGVEIAFLPTADTEIELISPLDPENSIGRFLEKRGEGIHHLCVGVEDIEAAVAQLQDEGARVLSEIKRHADGTRYVFIHPKSTHGVLMELYQKPEA
ncbi:MAG: methylmalonyl-CoA epimerase [Anaerolineales bacterium]